MNRINGIITIVAVLIALAAANILVARHPVRLDLTENQLYTLAPSTRRILAGLSDIVTIRVYFTDKLPPALENLRRDVEDILAEFKGAAGERLQVEHVDPSASLFEEQQAAAIGIPPVQLNVVERDKHEVAKVFLGLAVLFGNRQQVIPVVQRIDHLEYDLAEAIVKVSTPKLPAVAWRQGEVNEEAGEGFRLLREAIGRRYELLTLDAKGLAELDPGRAPALILASPRALSDDELFGIDQYLMGGGRIIALVDRYEVSPRFTAVEIETPATELLISYGVTVEQALALDQINAMAAFAGGVVTYRMPYPYWPEVRRGQFAENDPLVSDLESVVLPWTSPLVLAGGAGTGAALAKTSPMGTMATGKELQLDPQAAGEALRSGRHEPLTLAAILSGPFHSFFAPGGEHAPPAGREARAEGDAGARLFVVGSSRWLTDRALSTFPASANLFENVLDSFAMGDLLIDIRSRANTSRPIVQMSDAVRMLLRYANVAIGPVIVLAVGAIIFAFRRSRRRWVRAAYR